uniref:GPI ethanolamine phosphate transferase 1 n=1 Tax=Steinernema glaseri TaxID=37863 RepID=A0A1I7ZMH6_9BILA
MVVAFLLLALQRLPLSNFIYVLLPIWLFSITFNINDFSVSLQDVLAGCQKAVDFYQGGNYSPLTSQLSAWFTKVSLSVIVLSIFVTSFTNRSFLSLMTLLMLGYPKLTGTEHLKPWTQAWYACCLVLSLFPQLDTVGNSPSPFLCVSAPAVSSVALFLISRRMAHWQTARVLAGLHLVSAVSILLTNLTDTVPWIISVYAWVSLPVAFVLPTTSSTVIVERLLVWSASFLIPYTLLSLAYESVFLILYASLLGIFVRLEMSHLSDVDFLRISFVSDSSRKRTDSRMDDIHGSFSHREWYRAAMLVAFILLGFFGTGNIASLNSFNPSFLRLFLTVFSPFTMAALLIVKIAIPFALVSFAYTAILHQDRRGVPRLSVLVLIITNTMAMNFFFFLKDDGSWLDIGMSISNYLISLFASLFIFLLLHGVNLLFPVKFIDLTRWVQNQKDRAAV